MHLVGIFISLDLYIDAISSFRSIGSQCLKSGSSLIQMSLNKFIQNVRFFRNVSAHHIFLFCVKTSVNLLVNFLL